MNTPQQLCFNTNTQRVCLSLYNLNNNVAPLSTQVIVLETPDDFSNYFAGNANLTSSIIAPFTSNRNTPNTNNPVPNNNTTNTNTTNNTNNTNNTPNNQTTGRGLAAFINPNFFSQ